MNGTEQGLLAQAFIEWLQSRTGNTVDRLHGDAPFRAMVGESEFAFTVETVSSAVPDLEWQRSRDALVEQLGSALQPGVLVWLPAGFEVPDDEPGRATFIDAVGRTLSTLAAGTAAEARLPVVLRIQKRDDQGAYVSASGGLSQHWARFTDRVSGYFQIDGSALLRPPRDPVALEALIEQTVLASKPLALGQIASVDAEELLPVQRLNHGRGCAIVGITAGDDSERGAALRRRLRNLLRETGAALRDSGAVLRALLLVGHYASAEDEPVGPALRGLDPSLFDGIDFVALAVDGTMKLLLDVTRRPELGAESPGA